MRIKDIGIQGFKSFVDRTVLRMGPGISCVVGPNGCGKSNVIDAIKWVIGEQNARSLRGASMSDIIFAGTDSRAATGLAEVTLTLTDEAGGFPGAYEPFSELQVTRRLFRSGNSEYLINQQPARLRDIKDLFLDTGVGSKGSYAIIEQGRVEQMISARPEERRTIIEEAAGISRYKARRDEALRRLDQTTQNLLRVTDLMKELGGQLGRLERQAQKAEIWLDLKERVERGDLLLGLIRVKTLGERLAQTQADLRAQEEALERANEAVEKEEWAVQALRARLGDEGRQLGKLRDIVASAEGDLKVKVSQVGLSEREIEGLKEALTRLEVESEKATARIEAAEAEARKAEEIYEAAQDALIVAEDQRAEREGRLEEGLKKMGALGADLEEGKQRLIQHLTEAARLRNQLANLDARGEELSGRAHRNRTQVEEILSTEAEVETRHGDLLERRDLLNRGQVEVKARIEEGREALAAVEEEVARLDTRLSQARGDHARVESRLESLKELERRLEGFGDGPRAVLTERSKEESGALGTVADVLEVPRDYEAAVEGVLGPRLQWILVEDRDAGADNVVFLRSGERGRASFVPLDLSPHPLGERISGQGLIGPLLSHLSWEGRFDAIVQALLADVLLVEGLDYGLSLWEKGGRRHTFVTLQGDVIDRNGVIHGGAGGGGGILRKKGEIRELTRSLRDLSERLEALEGQLESLRASRLDQQEIVDTLRIQMHEGELQVVRLDRDLSQVDNDLKRLSAQRRTLELDSQQLGDQRAQLEADKAAAQGKIDALDTTRKAQEGALGVLSKELDVLRRGQESEQEALMELRVRVVEAKGRADGAQRDMARLKAEVAQVKEEVLAREENRRRTFEKLARARGQLQDAQEAVEALRARLEDLKVQISKLSRGYGELKGELETREAALIARRRETADGEQALRKASVALTELRMQVDHLVSGVRERHRIDLFALFEAITEGPRPRAAAIKAPIAAPIQPAEPAADAPAEGGAPEQEPPPDVWEVGDRLRAGWLALDALEGAARAQTLATLEEETDAARARFSRMGSVNLDAIHAYTELKKRVDFTAAQEADLQRSVDDLKKTITRINRKSRERFRKAFEAINENFQEIFPKVFEGGNARLILTDPDNILESGVDIEVQPPGKKVQNMNLLSGGEKAMTAVALIFALFRVRPSPFCILDEVDAPLDEANSGRFHEVVKELSEVSQFIVITHNKRTMEVADTLYGVTMEEPGVSRVVAVDLS